MEVIGHHIRGNVIRAQDDYRLVQIAVAGNQHAYSALLGRYRKSIYQFMLQRVKNPAEAEDLTMEAFEKAFHKLSSYTPTHAFSTWLFRIALNNCIDYSRKKQVPIVWTDTSTAAYGFESSGLRNKPSDMLSPEDVMIRQQRIALMQSLLGHLNKRYRRLIELRYYEDMSYEEIAAQLDIPLGTVKAQLFRAKERLYKLLQQPRAQDYLDRKRRH
ncbi:MAG: sigma-70 family RNA polymerase sigma factor [Lewinellaceae bacterium]|jgi:RNA polymerase sigma factor (sigma-70 family)|nr:sigma-70 family RNA polymerase sigma factor [Lewinellaceae bacterium]